ncbi:MAG: histidinol-phosphatase [Fimbriimonadaceae bacterium]|jgi:histidinol phosphatase-like enzyme (inositol monophosphatase family)|nr:histidinol-phosphatase [Fimbriimonadaceae bacterium]
MSPRLAFAIEAAVKAGNGTLAHFQKGVEVQTKEDDSPVTIADREAERLLRQEIEKQYPGEAILGEEEGETGAGDNRWVIDPIDGTKSFICGVPLYATLLSFERDGEPEIAVCHLPALNELLYAERGQGAYWNGQPCRASLRPTLQGAVLSSAGYLGLKQKSLMEGFDRISEKAMATRTWCDAYGHALVATGRVDAMIDPSIKRWDISAMSLIVREAGGRFTDLEGREELGDSAMSSNGLIHEELLRGLQT